MQEQVCVYSFCYINLHIYHFCSSSLAVNQTFRQVYPNSAGQQGGDLALCVVLVYEWHN